MRSSPSIVERDTPKPPLEAVTSMHILVMKLQRKGSDPSHQRIRLRGTTSYLQESPSSPSIATIDQAFLSLQAQPWAPHWAPP
jgi:hypothetical protein